MCKGASLFSTCSWEVGPCFGLYPPLRPPALQRGSLHDSPCHEFSFSGAVNPALEFEKTFWLENPEEISSIGIWLERAKGKPCQGPEFQEMFGTRQGTQSPQGSNPGCMSQSASPCEERTKPVPEETSLRHGRKKKEKGKRRKKTGQDCDKNLPPSLPETPTIPAEVKMYYCSYCVESFADSSDLLTHERAHIREKVYICSQCEQRFPHHFELLAHKRNHH